MFLSTKFTDLQYGLRPLQTSSKVYRQICALPLSSSQDIRFPGANGPEPNDFSLRQLCT